MSTISANLTATIVSLGRYDKPVAFCPGALIATTWYDLRRLFPHADFHQCIDQTARTEMFEFAFNLCRRINHNLTTIRRKTLMNIRLLESLDRHLGELEEPRHEQ